jgi:hypothetical protein
MRFTASEALSSDQKLRLLELLSLELEEPSGLDWETKRADYTTEAVTVTIHPVNPPQKIEVV